MNYDYIDLPSQSKSSKSSISLGWKHAYFAAHQWSPQFVPNSASCVPRCWKITLFTEFPMGLFYMGCVQRWMYTPPTYHHFIGKVCFLTIKKLERAPSRAENVSSCPHLAPGWISIYLKGFLKNFRLSIGFFGGFPCFETTPSSFPLKTWARSTRGQLSTFPTSSNFSRIACSALASASASGRRRRLDGWACWASKSWIWPWKNLDSSQAEMMVFYYETLSQDGI